MRTSKIQVGTIYAYHPRPRSAGADLGAAPVMVGATGLTVQEPTLGGGSFPEVITAVAGPIRQNMVQVTHLIGGEDRREKFAPRNNTSRPQVVRTSTILRPWDEHRLLLDWEWANIEDRRRDYLNNKSRFEGIRQQNTDILRHYATAMKGEGFTFVQDRDLARSNTGQVRDRWGDIILRVDPFGTPEIKCMGGMTVANILLSAHGLTQVEEPEEDDLT